METKTTMTQTVELSNDDAKEAIRDWLNRKYGDKDTWHVAHVSFNVSVETTGMGLNESTYVVKVSATRKVS